MVRLDEIKVSSLIEKGWIGPLDAFSKEEIDPIKSYIEKVSSNQENNDKSYMSFYNDFLGRDTPRDHHFSCPELLNLFSSEKITGYLNQLGEPDLLLWKTNIFHKNPGQLGIGWHQAHDYFGHEVEEDVPHEEKTLHFPLDQPAQSLVVWLAIEDATIENGCVSFASGSHKHRFKSVKVPFSDSALSNLTSQKMEWQKNRKYSKKFIFNENDWKIEPVPVKAGQILIFTEDVMHMSPKNQSDKVRFGINARYISPNIKVYPHREHGNFIDGTGHNIENHYCVLVSGNDHYGINKLKN